MSDIKIECGTGWSKCWVDGVELNRMTGLVVEAKPGQPMEVRVALFARQADFDLTGAVLKIGGAEMPEALEKALLDYLCAKYPMQAMVGSALLPR